jgi:uncharacterized protein
MENEYQEITPAQNETRYYPGIGQSWGIVGIAVVLMIVFSPVNLLLNNFVGKGISLFIYYLLSIGGTFWIAHLQRIKRTGINQYRFEIGSGKILLLVSIAVITLQIGVVSPLVGIMPMPDFMKKVFLELSKQTGVFSFITIVIAAPVLEELIFRGIILDGLLKRYSPMKSIVVSSILFGIVHLNPWQFIAALVIGFFSGWVYYKTRQLSLSILIHFVNNSVAFVSMYFGDTEAWMNESLIDYYGGVVNLIAITGGAISVAILCLYFLRLEFLKKEPAYGNA